MTTITINQDIDLDKLTFESLSELRNYLFEQQQLNKLETLAFFSELDRRMAEAEQNPEQLRTIGDLTSRLNELK